MLQGCLQRLAVQVSEQQAKVARAQAALDRARAALSEVQALGDPVRQQIQALTVVIETMSPGVNPEAVRPVKAWAGKYGARSGLKDFVLSQLRAAYPEPRTTQELCRAVQSEFGVRLLTRKDRQSFVSTVRSLLSIQRRLGVVESLTPLPGDGSGVGRWRWREQTTTFEALRARETPREKDSSDAEVAAQRACGDSR